MITNSVKSNPSNAARRSDGWLALFAKALAVAVIIGGFLVQMRTAQAQVPPLTFEVLAAGFTPEHRVRLRATGPSDILQTRIVAQPGGDTGWHTHPGPAIVVVKTGTVTEYHDNGCVSVHQAGEVFFEAEGKVHRLINHGSVESEAYVTFILPHGSQPLEPAADPGTTICRAGH